MQRGPRPRLVATSHRLASCMIVSEFRAALDLNTYPLRNFVHGVLNGLNLVEVYKPVLIMHIGFLACFHAISLEHSRFSKIATLLSYPCSTEAVGIAISCLVACSP